jgi:hypothetical protein
MWPNLLSIDCFISGPNQIDPSKPVCVHRFYRKKALVNQAIITHVYSVQCTLYTRVSHSPLCVVNVLHTHLIWLPIVYGLLEKYYSGEIFFFMSPQGGYSVNIAWIFLSPKCPLWVVWTCVSGNLTQCQRNQLNQITPTRESVQNVVRICCFGPSSK